MRTATKERYWFLAYQITGSVLGSGIVSNIALAGIHPLVWIGTLKDRAPTANRLGMTEHVLFYAEIDGAVFAEIERANVIPVERAMHSDEA